MPKRRAGASDDAVSATSGEASDATPKAAAMPLDFMLALLRDPEASIADRKWAAEKAAPYIHPRLQTVEHGGELTLRHEEALKDLA